MGLQYLVNIFKEHKTPMTRMSLIRIFNSLSKMLCIEKGLN